MREYSETINCPSREYQHYSGKTISYSSREYQLYAYEIDPNAYAEDKEFVERTCDEAHKLAERMSPYNTDGVPRPWEERLKDAYLGVLAEKLIRKYLRTEFGQAANVDSEPYTTYDEHVDIKINWHTGDPTTIEVRSSFAYGSMSRVVCNTFDHLGQYTTVYKLYEPPKDYYLRGILFEGQIRNSFSSDRKHILYFAGGIPHNLFEEKGQIKKERKMVEISLEDAERLLASGRKVTLYMTTPIPQGLDASQIINQMRSIPKVVQKQSEISEHF